MAFIDPQLISDAPYVTESPSQMEEEQAEFSFADFPFNYVNNDMMQYSPYAEPYPEAPLQSHYQPEYGAGYFLDPQLPSHPTFAASEYPYYTQYVSAATQTVTSPEAPLPPVQQDAPSLCESAPRNRYSLRSRVVSPSLPPRLTRAQKKATAKALREKALRKSRVRERLSSPSLFQPEQLTKPLSKMVSSMPSFHGVDLEAFLRRSADSRITRGKITRPLNAFILYRIAYGKVARSLLPLNQNQQVSRIVGASWKMEDRSVREYFHDLACREKVNHAMLFPKYKYLSKKRHDMAEYPLPEFADCS
ncbi:hypothetical protein RRF57_006022 [Xylaria bambusicola]|uniref:HMG box domain-containing protein n=1 Tax=Xylaria bambusicola TaxID=326684 RepID=A0AAN7Z6H2_9PEZI